MRPSLPAILFTSLASLASLASVLPIALPVALVTTGCGAATRPDGGTGLLPVGSQVPDLAATDQQGKEHKLSAERGHPVVVYFYPKDATPGCTKEACAFRDAWESYQKAGVQVFGVSADDVGSHAEFAKDQKIPFPILADTERSWINTFGVPLKLGMASRVTFLLDKDGKVAKVYPDVDPGVHAEQVLKDATALPK